MAPAADQESPEGLRRLEHEYSFGSGQRCLRRLFHVSANVSQSNIFLLLFVFLFLQSLLPAWGQSAEIAGTVTDPSKAVIPNSSIEIVETATQVKWDTISNGDGRYVAPSLAPGVYQITVQAPKI